MVAVFVSQGGNIAVSVGVCSLDNELVDNLGLAKGIYGTL